MRSNTWLSANEFLKEGLECRKSFILVVKLQNISSDCFAIEALVSTETLSRIHR